MLIKQIIPQEFCLNCSGCCRFSQQESIWSPHLLEDELGLLGEILINANPSGDNFICNHLDLHSNKCRIYPARPFECQFYPFLFDRKKGSFFLALDINCVYVSRHKDDEDFKRYIQSLTGIVRTSEVADILRKNPQLFQDYPGVIDLVELKI